MPIISICDGCGRQVGTFTRNSLSGKRLRTGVFCDNCFKPIEDYAIRKYQIKIQDKNEIGKY